MCQKLQGKLGPQAKKEDLMQRFRRCTRKHNVTPAIWLTGLLFAAASTLGYAFGGPLGWMRARGWWFAWVVLPFAAAIIQKDKTLYGVFDRSWLEKAIQGGIVGAVWRLVSVLMNYALVKVLSPATSPGANALFALLVWAPLVEELYFRGLLLRYRPGRFWACNIIQAALFAVYPPHLGYGPAIWPSIFLFGIIAGWLYRRTDSLWAPIGAHFVGNALTVLVEIIF